VVFFDNQLQAFGKSATAKMLTIPPRSRRGGMRFLQVILTQHVEPDHQKISLDSGKMPPVKPVASVYFYPFLTIIKAFDRNIRRHHLFNDDLAI
jgi:hypothetical protein